jgi:hypothetical protein
MHKNDSPLSSYRTTRQVINEMDTLTTIKHDIRNMRTLNKQQINFIKYSISNNDKNDIIELFNHCITVAIELVMEL